MQRQQCRSWTRRFNFGTIVKQYSERKRSLTWKLWSGFVPQLTKQENQKQQLQRNSTNYFKNSWKRKYKRKWRRVRIEFTRVISRKLPALLFLRRSDEFSRRRQVLAANRKSLVQSGFGNKPNATRELTEEEQEKVFKTRQLGDHDPLVLQRTLWWFLSSHFGFRARDESRTLYWGDVLLEKDPETGRELLVWRTERGSKTRQGSSETGHRRPFSPKLFATGDSRCPVKFYKAFEKRRPDETRNPEAPFYLAVKQKRRACNTICVRHWAKIKWASFCRTRFRLLAFNQEKPNCQTTPWGKPTSVDCLTPIFPKTT